MTSQTDFQLAALDPRSIYKLSKARKSGSSTNISVATASSTELASISSFGQTSSISRTNTVVTSSSGECRSRRDSRHKLRAHLFGTSPETIHKDSSDEESEGKNGLVEAARGVRDCLTRTSTAVTQRSGICTSKSQRRVLQSQALVTPDFTEPYLEDLDHVADQIRERAYFDHIAALNHVSSPVDEDMHVDSVASPIRRRSLFTPGIATRTPSDILRKLPSTERTLATTEQESGFNTLLPKSSLFPQLSDLDLIDRSRSSPGPRTSTPSTLDYTQLGGLKPGTLRITNGTESPIPRNPSPFIIPRKPLRTICPLEDYFTASEGRSSEDEDAIRPSSKSIQQSNKQPVESANTSLIRKDCIDEARHADMPITHCLVKLQYSENPLDYRNEATRSLSVDESNQRKPKELFHNTQIADLRAPPSAQTDEDPKIEDSSVAGLPRSPVDDSVDANLDFDSVHQPNKRFYRLSRAKSSKFTSPQKLIHNWNGFIDEAERRHSENQLHHFESLILTSFDEPSPATQMESGSISPSNMSTKAEHFHIGEENEALQLHTTTDSGYSSSSSIKSSEAPSLCEDLGNPNLPNPSTAESQNHSNVIENPQDLSLKASEQEPILNTPTKQSSRTRPSSCIVQTLAAKSGLLDSSTQSSSSTTMITGYTVKSTPLASTSRKLRKQRPLSQPPPEKLATVQAGRDIGESHIPPIPADIAAKHAARLDKFPSLEHTFPSLHHTDLKDRISSPALDFVSIRFPSPIPAKDEGQTLASSSQIELPEETNDVTLDRLNHRRSRTSFSFSNRRRRSSRNRTTQGCDTATSIFDFGTVIESLGGSPYDIARSTACSENLQLSKDTPPSPHQMSTKTPRAKSMLGMDELDAINLSRLRSQQTSHRSSRAKLIANSELEDTQSQQMRPVSLNSDIPPVPTLPISLASKTFDHRFGIPGKLPRPRSLVMDVPPLPALPTLEQVDFKEAEISRLASERGHILRPPHQTTNCLEGKLSEVRKQAIVRDIQKPVPDIMEGCKIDYQASSQRRRSADEERPQGPQFTPGSNAAKDHRSPVESFDTRTKVARPLTFVAQHPSHTLIVPPRHFHIPIAPSSSSPLSHDSCVTSLTSKSSPHGQPQGLSGRFEGGLSFGYEPGFGIGGSAGTRSMKTGASRKSIEVSLGYGIDLSDVPIFVAPS